jgi:TatD DNase family protein
LLIDSHIHLDSDRYNEDRRAVLERAYATGVTTILSIGIGETPEEMSAALGHCREFNGKPGTPRQFVSAGIYPHTTALDMTPLLAKLVELLAQPEVIACGEIGIDYYHEGATRSQQLAGLKAQLALAAKHKRPILIHCRPEGDDPVANPAAWDDLFATLESDWNHTGLGGIMHCFSGSLEQARRSIELGFLISFAGNLTFPKAQSLRDVAAVLPLDSLLVETDAPWLAPAPDRGKRNEPAFVARTAELLAGLRGITLAELAEATTKNFQRLFHLTPNVGN